MGELDEISYKIGQLSNAVTTQTQVISDLNHKVDSLLALCPARGKMLEGHEHRLKDLEKKDVIGGTTKTEKALIGIGVIGQALKWVYDIIFTG